MQHPRKDLVGLAAIAGLLVFAPGPAAAAVIVRGDGVAESAPRPPGEVFKPHPEELRIFELVNAARIAEGLRPLAWDGALARVARAHSGDMAARGRLAHLGRDGGGPIDRLRRSGLFPSLMLENIGIAESPRQAHWALMRSLGHRANILSPEVERVGVGVVKVVLADGSRQLWVTQDFTRALPPVSENTVAAARVRIDELRREAGRAPLGEDVALARLSQELAASVASGRIGPAAVSATVRERLPSLPIDDDVRVLVIHTVDVRRMGPLAAVADPALSSAGVGVAIASSDGAADVVVLLARDRR